MWPWRLTCYYGSLLVGETVPRWFTVRWVLQILVHCKLPPKNYAWKVIKDARVAVKQAAFYFNLDESDQVARPSAPEWLRSSGISSRKCFKTLKAELSFCQVNPFSSIDSWSQAQKSDYSLKFACAWRCIVNKTAFMTVVSLSVINFHRGIRRLVCVSTLSREWAYYTHAAPLRDVMLPSIKHCRFPIPILAGSLVSVSALRPLRTRTICSVVVVYVVYMYILASHRCVYSFVRIYDSRVKSLTVEVHA